MHLAVMEIEPQKLSLKSTQIAIAKHEDNQLIVMSW